MRNDLLTQARAEGDAGRHLPALELAQRAMRIMSSPSLRYFVAQQYVALGRIGPALGEAMVCGREVDSGASVGNREELRRACRELVDTLQPRVGHVRVPVPNPLPREFELRIADELVPETLLGLPYVVSPGRVAVELRAPGWVAARREIEVGEGQTVDVEVPFARAPSQGRELPPPPPPPPPPPLPPPPPPAPPPRSLVGPVVVLSGGVSGLVVGSVLGVLQLGAAREFERQYCDPSAPTRCLAGAAAHRGDVDGLALGANVAFVVGGAAIAGGGAWLLYALLAPSPRATGAGTAATLEPFAMPGYAGLSVRGAL